MDDVVKLPFIHQEIYGVEPSYLFFDEVQALIGWEKIIYTLHEKRRYFIFITGSSSKLLAKEVATQLRGRVIPIYVYPFSFIEILNLEDVKPLKPLDLYKAGRIKHLLTRYVEIELNKMKLQK